MSDQPRRVTDAELRSMVAKLNRLAQRHQGLQLAQRVGRTYVGWEDDGLRVSLRSLGQHADAILRRSRLTNYVSVYRQSLGLQPRAQDLPLSAHTELLKVNDPETKRELVERYIDGSWSLEDLEEAIADVLHEPVHRRKMKGLAAELDAAVASLGKDRVRDSLEQFDLEEGQQLAAKLIDAAAALAEGVLAAARREESASDSDPDPDD